MSARKSSRRSSGSGRNSALNALEALSRARTEGIKRSEQFEAPKTAPIYQELDEEEYRQKVEQNRAKGIHL